MFWSRYFVGFAGIIISVVIPFIISFFININIFGYSNELMKSLVYFLSGYTVIGLLSYSVSVAVCSLAGTKFESIVFSIGLVMFPTIVFYVIDSLCKIFLFGNSYNNLIARNYIGETAETLFIKLYSFNPILFVMRYLNYYSISELDVDDILPEINFIPVIIFGIIVIAVSILGNIFYKNYKAEKSEVLGTNKVMNFFIAFVLGIFVFNITLMTLNEITNLNNIITIFISFIIYIIVYILIKIFFERKIKFVVKNLKLVLIYIALIVPVIPILLAGGFGYSSYIPDIEDIETVSVSYMGNPNYINRYMDGGSYHGPAPVAGYNCMIKFDTINDIEIVTRLHKDIINKGKNISVSSYNENNAQETFVREAVTIKYTLKNKKIVYRNYDSLDMETIESFLKLDNTDKMKEVLSNTLNGDENYYKTDGVENRNVIYISNPYLSNLKEVELNDEDNGELMQCLYNDITNQSIEDCYFTDDEILGIISINDDFEISPYDFTGNKYYITNKFSSTINYLKLNNLFEIFNSRPEIKEISVAKSSLFVCDNDNYYVQNKYSDTILNDIYIGYLPEEYMRLEDNKIDELIPLIKPSYFMTRGGYVVKMKIKNEGDIVKEEYINVYQFLPYQSAPDYIKNVLK